MALEGSLKEFGLADILQLIYYQRKTGVLTIESRQDRVRLLFHEGKIVGAESRKRLEDNRIGRILVKRGLITEDSLREALSEQKTSGGRLGHLLLRKSLVEKEQLLEILTSHITEIITQIFSWKEGKYEFKPQGVPLDRELPLELDTQHILMEGLRVVDEWSVLMGRVNLDSVFKRTDTPIPDDIGDAEREILQLIDGKTDVLSISEAIGGDGFETSKIVAGLLDRALIEPVREEKKEEVVPIRAAIKTPLETALIIGSSVLGLIISLIIWQFNSIDMKTQKASESVDRIRFLIEAYKYENNSYPKDLSTIYKGNDPWGSPYYYTLTDGGYKLFSPGPDREPSTGDDIY